MKDRRVEETVTMHSISRGRLEWERIRRLCKTGGYLNDAVSD